MTKTKHTPLPWGYDGDGFDSVSAQLCDTDGYTIFPLDENGTACGHIAEMSEVEGDDEAEANAIFIVHAVNNHYQLVEALTVLLFVAEASHTGEFISTEQRIAAQDKARAVLEVVKGDAS